MVLIKEMEQEIFSNVMKIGFIAMQCYFAAKGTGDMGPKLCSENEEVFKRESSLRGKNYFSILENSKSPGPAIVANQAWEFSHLMHKPICQRTVIHT